VGAGAILATYGGLVGGSLYDSADAFGTAWGCEEGGYASIWDVTKSGFGAAVNGVSTALFIGGVLSPALAPPPQAGLPEPLVEVYRGVNANHPDIELARGGIARAPGGHSDPVLHSAGNTDSIFTSWTTSLSQARMRADLAGPGGVVLQDQVPLSAMQRSGVFPNEEEFLRVGAIRARVLEQR
jgi:hypothetical protein